jgi:Z1 domain
VTSDGERIEGHVALVRILMTRDGCTFDQALTSAGALIPADDHKAVLAHYRRQTSTTIELLQPGVLSDGGPRAWFGNYDPSQGYYWRRQRAYLAHTIGRKDFEIDSLDQASNKVLSHLEDPKLTTPFAIRGLVMGHVQSGKTANFSALIAKAADRGYKIVIVLSGLHNTLRQQTQRRLEHDLGRENVPGVGEPEPGRRWVWMTGSEAWGDFDPKGASAGGTLQGNDHVIFVVKKNKTRLQRLNAWMQGRVPPDVPVLVIDDEADQASINTRGNRSPREEVDLVANSDFDGDVLSEDELDPSAINLNIRTLIRSFAKCSYVAYTATPFANVLIDPDALDIAGGNDLFPSHFIISLPIPPGGDYVGAAQLFGRDRLPGDADTAADDGLDVIEFVPDYEVDMLVPPPRHGAGFTPTVPASLKQALTDYVLASAAWLHRSGQNRPCAMLIHTDMRRAMQNPLATEVTAELAYIRQRWLYEAEEFRPALAARWNARFRPVSIDMDLTRDAEFDAIAPYVDRLLRDGVVVKVLNSDWPDNIDFDAEPNLKAVLIGGNKLSRGVTIEGLMVSYYVRETLYYDTLMQMGRWFGYRGQYVDLTRLYSTKLLVGCFHDLATAEEELRRQISRYDRERLTPAQFVPRVRTHPVMAVTQKNKMRSATAVTVNYAGDRIQTIRVPEKVTPALVFNLETTRNLLSALGPPTLVEGQPTWSGVDPGFIIEFLLMFQVSSNDLLDPRSVVDYISEQRRNGELTRWRVLLSCAKTLRDDSLWYEDLGVEGMTKIPLIARSRKKMDPTSLGVVTDPGDELLGLDPGQIKAAEEDALDGKYSSKAEAYRAYRDPAEGLLMIYPISAASDILKNSTTRVKLFETPEKAATVIAYAVSFPFSESEATVEYVAASSRQGPL